MELHVQKQQKLKTAIKLVVSQMSSIQSSNQDCRQIVIGRRSLQGQSKSQLREVDLYQDFYVKFIKSNMEEMGPTSQETSLDSQTLVWLRETIKRTASELTDFSHTSR